MPWSPDNITIGEFEDLPSQPLHRSSYFVPLDELPPVPASLATAESTPTAPLLPFALREKGSGDEGFPAASPTSPLVTQRGIISGIIDPPIPTADAILTTTTDHLTAPDSPLRDNAEDLGAKLLAPDLALRTSPDLALSLSTSTFGTRLRSARQAIGIATLRQFSELLAAQGLTRSAASLGNWERDRNRPSKRTQLLPILALIAQRGGFSTLPDINDLLWLLDWRNLNAAEIAAYFPAFASPAPSESAAIPTPSSALTNSPTVTRGVLPYPASAAPPPALPPDLALSTQHLALPPASFPTPISPAATAPPSALP